MSVETTKDLELINRVVGHGLNGGLPDDRHKKAVESIGKYIKELEGDLSIANLRLNATMPEKNVQDENYKMLHALAWFLAHDYVEFSHDKTAWQRDDYIRRAKKVLELVDDKQKA